MTRPKPATRIRDVLPRYLRVLRRFWPKIKPQTPLILASLLAMLVQIGMRLLQPWPLKIIIDEITGAESDLGGPIAEWMAGLQPMALITVAALAIVIIAIISAVATYTSTVWLAVAGNRVLISVRRDLYNHLLQLSLAYHHQAKIGDTITRITGDVSRLQDVIITAALPLLMHSLTLIGMVALMFMMNWQLAVMAILTYPILIWSLARLSGRIQQAARDQRKKDGALAATAAESLSAMEVIQAYTLEKTVEASFAQQSKKSLKEGVKVKRLSARLERTVDILVAVGTAIVLWVGSWMALRGMLTAGDLIVFLNYLKGAFMPTRSLAKYTGRLAKAAASGERVLEVLEIPLTITSRPGAFKAPVFRGAVVYDAVTFRYHPQEVILQDVSFSVRPGERIALVGPSGGGKSTLVRLLLRLIDPGGGRILIDGVDIREFILESLRSQIAIVLQESVLFAVSVRENILYGKLDASMEEVIQAAKLANAHKFIMQLPEGYDTVQGARGATLSGGQRQRIAIARAAIGQCPLLILDEPTTGLDRRNAYLVQEALARLSSRSTTFLIAHDLHSAIHADRILYLERGRIIEQGTHEQLMSLQGRYAAMYAYQSITQQVKVTREALHAQ